jgi:hypothetical protein
VNEALKKGCIFGYRRNLVLKLRILSSSENSMGCVFLKKRRCAHAPVQHDFHLCMEIAVTF